MSSTIELAERFVRDRERLTIPNRQVGTRGAQAAEIRKAVPFQPTQSLAQELAFPKVFAPLGEDFDRDEYNQLVAQLDEDDHRVVVGRGLTKLESVWLKAVRNNRAALRKDIDFRDPDLPQNPRGKPNLDQLRIQRRGQDQPDPVAFEEAIKAPNRPILDTTGEKVKPNLTFR